MTLRRRHIQHRGKAVRDERGGLQGHCSGLPDIHELDVGVEVVADLDGGLLVPQGGDLILGL
jgi:hypothetical protein